MPLFFVIFLAVTALFHLYSYRRFIRRCLICENFRKFFLSLLLLNYAGVIAYVLARLLPFPHVLTYLGSLSVGLMFIFFVSTLLYELLQLLRRAVPLDPKRRAFFKKSADYGIFAFAVGYAGEGIRNNLREPALRQILLEQKLFQKRLRIVQISDLHITEVMDAAFVGKIVRRINALDPDIIAITGDLADAGIGDIRGALDWLKLLTPKHGSYFVTGNHEFYTDVHAITAYLSDIGIEVMDNRALYIEELGLNIAGVPDFEAKRFGGYEAMDIPKVVRAVNGRAPTLLLAHQPRAVKYLGEFKPHLTLSGHTHGGQLFPFNYLVRLQQPYVKGLHRHQENGFIYVSSGTGFWGPPMRVGTTSEISCIDWS